MNMTQAQIIGRWLAHLGAIALSTVISGIVCCILVLMGCSGVAVAQEVPPSSSLSNNVESASDNTVNTQQLPDSSFLYDTSIGALASADSYYNNQTVQITGEVIGDSIKDGFDGTHRWITLSAPGDSATIAVYMTSEQASLIDTFGAYGKEGTTLQVKGVFHLASVKHQGITSVDADVVQVVKPGRQQARPFDADRFVPGISVVALGLVITGAFYWVRERRR